MKLGISSYSYGWAIGVPGLPPPRPMTAFELLARAVELEVRVLQVGDNLPLDALGDAGLARLRQEADATGVRLETGTRGIDPEHLRHYLRIATRLRSDLLRVVVDTRDHHPTEEEIVARLRPLMPEFERAGVCLAIENHDRFRARALRRILELVDSPALGICLDTANSLGAQEGVEQVAETLAPWIANLHVKDFAIRRLSHLMGFLVEGRAAGEGDLDVPGLIGFVRDRVPRPVNVILELWPPPETSIEATLAKEDEWVARSVRYLRGLVPE